MDKKEQGVLNEYESKKIISHYGIPVVSEGIASSPEEAVEIAEDIGYPVVLKVLSPQIQHKTEASVIRLNVNSRLDLLNEFDEIVEKAKKYNKNVEIDGVLVQEMITSRATEVIIGMKADPQFGPVIMFGLGGILVELYEDISLRLPPLSEKEVKDMIEEVKAFKILKGYRGKPKADLKAIKDSILKLSKLSMDFENTITEIDINPFMVSENGGKAVDSLIAQKGKG